MAQFSWSSYQMTIQDSGKNWAKTAKKDEAKNVKHDTKLD